MQRRKTIPKDIADRLLVDAMHRCCLCPEHHDITDKHHIIAISEGGPDAQDNLMVVCPTCHAKIHRIRGRYNPDQLRMYKERWVALCRLGLPLDVRLAQACNVEAPPPTAAPSVPLAPQPYFAHPYPLQQHFTGRVEERKELTEWLVSRSGETVLALVAIGGMGKSALSWVWVQRDVLGQDVAGVKDDTPEVAAQCRVPDADRPEGLLWWSFYDRESSFTTFLNEALAYVSEGRVGPKQMASDYDKVRLLIQLLQQRRHLLVLDGFERELRAYASLSAAYQGDRVAEDAKQESRGCCDPNAARFLEWLVSTPMASRVLLTTRLFPRELDGCAPCRHKDLERLNRADALAFFRAHGITGTQAEIEAACEPYDYHPLALSLLAGFILRDKRHPGDIRAANEHPILGELKGKSGKGQHHILEVAYDTLDAEKRSLLSRIAAFRNPMDYEAVSIFNPYETAKTFDAALDELADRGLLLFHPARRVYDLHPLVRAYAYRRLEDKTGVHHRLCGYYFELAWQAGADAPRTIEDLAPAIELYHHVVASRRYDEAHWLYHDRLAQPLLYEFGAYATSVQLLSPLLPDDGDGEPHLTDAAAKAWVLTALGASLLAAGEPRRALVLTHGACALLKPLGRPHDRVMALAGGALCALSLGALGAAEASLTEGLRLSRSAKDEFGEAMLHQELARVLTYGGRFGEAEFELTASSDYWRSTEDAQGLCLDNAYRAKSALLRRDGLAALHAAREARASWEADAAEVYPVPRDLVSAEWLLGAAYVALAAEPAEQRQHHLAEAEKHLTEALTRCRRINLVEFEPSILLSWAKWHRLKDNAKEARAHAEEALGIADRCEYRLNQAEIHNFLAQLALDEGGSEKAAEEAKTAYERAWCDGPPYSYKPALDEAKAILDQLGAKPPKTT